MDNKNIEKMSIKDLKNSKIYQKLSQNCKSSKLTKIELIKLLKDECNNDTANNRNQPYNILYDINDFDLDNRIEIGEGASSTVYLVKNEKDKKKYILKKVHKSKSELVIEEMDILNKVSSSCRKYFLCYNGYAYNRKYIFLITDFIPKSEALSDYLEKKGNKLTTLMKLFIIKQIVQGFIELHKQNVVHMDIKPANILITKNLDIKIIDYGFSCIKANKLCYKKIKGTPYFISPEVINEKVHNFEIARATDIWSIGITIYYIFNDKYPWYDRLSREELINKIRNLKKSIKSNTFGNIINPMLDLNPQSRLKNFQSVLNEINKEINNRK